MRTFKPSDFLAIPAILLFVGFFLYTLVNSIREIAPSSFLPAHIPNLILLVLTLFGAVEVAFLGALEVSQLPFSTALLVPLGVLVCAYGFFATFAFPHWMAWRVLGPRGKARAGRWILQLGIFRSAAARRGAFELYRIRFGGEERDLRNLPVTLWTLAASILQAERRGEAEKANELFALCDAKRFHFRSWRRPVSVAGEVLAWNALRGGDGGRARRVASVARLRGLRLPRLLAARALGEPVAAWRLRLAWLLSPGRAESLPFLRVALADPAPGLHAGAVPIPFLARSPQGRHLALLAQAARGRTITTGELEALAEAWSPHLNGGGSRVRLLYRAADLEAHDPLALPEDLHDSVLAELEILVERVEGEWSDDANALAATLRRSALGQAHKRVEREIEEFQTVEDDKAESRPMASGIEELELWVGLRQAVARLLRRGGLGALRTAWHAGLRTTACNWGVFIVRQQGHEASWPAYLMHRWSEELALQVGDDATVKLSRRNAKVTRPRLD